MIDRDKLIKGCTIMAALFAMLAFAEWRYSKSSWDNMKYVAMESEAEREVESAALESEKQAEYEATATKPVVIRIETEAPTMPETSCEILTETATETTAIETMSPSASEPLESDLVPLVDTFIAETTIAPLIAPTEPYIAPVAASAIMTAEEEQLIMRVASCEAGNQGWIGMALVMRVVLNRREAYGMSITDVIYAPRQFSVIGCDKWNSGFIAEEAPVALQAVKDGWDGSQGALFFCAPTHNSWHRSALTYLFTGWGHEYYK